MIKKSRIIGTDWYAHKMYDVLRIEPAIHGAAFLRDNGLLRVYRMPTKSSRGRLGRWFRSHGVWVNMGMRQHRIGDISIGYEFIPHAWHRIHDLDGSKVYDISDELPIFNWDDRPPLNYAGIVQGRNNKSTDNDNEKIVELIYGARRESVYIFEGDMPVREWRNPTSASIARLGYLQNRCREVRISSVASGDPLPLSQLQQMHNRNCRKEHDDEV
jgi:hypothetical protein